MIHYTSKHLFLLFIFLFVDPIIPQDYRRELNTFPVSNNDGLLSNIFSGGINNFEFQFVDIDDDSDADLFYLDSDGTYGLYRNTGSSSNPLFELKLDSLPGLFFYDWFYIVDIDRDNDFDIFTGKQGSLVSYLQNNGTPEEPLFQLLIDTVIDNEGNSIYSESGSNPSFTDMDNDGDYDFISGNSNGSLNYYENIGNAFEFNYKFITPAWQDLIIISGGAKVQNTSSNRLHGSSSLDFADIDADGDLDLFWGDFFSRSLYYIQNNGSPDSAAMEVINDFYPPADSVVTSGFNMPRLIDIDNDNDLDLFVSVLYDPTVSQSLILYENRGSSSHPDFKKVTDNYLNPFDVGTQSVLVFYDIDNDNDSDMFIGSSRNPLGSIMFLENTGTGRSPSFILRDSAYFNIKAELSLAPQFADMNGDNLPDLITGTFSGTLLLYINNGTAMLPNFVLTDTLSEDLGNIIDAGTLARPFIIDIDSDGDNDLVLGGFNGRLTLFNNTGSRSIYSFSEDPTYFSGIDVGSTNAPSLIDIDLDGDFDLFCGNHEGFITYFKNEGSILAPSWHIVSDKYLEFDFGADAAPVFWDIDSDGDEDLLAGNFKGGIYLFKNKHLTGVNSNKISGNYSILENYPNPFNSSTTIKFRIQGNQGSTTRLVVCNVLGEEVMTLLNGFYFNDVYELNFDAPGMSSGIYVLVLSSGAQLLTRKLVLIK